MAEMKQPKTVVDEDYDGYLESLGDDDIDLQLEWAIDYWQDRNEYIDIVRKHLEGLNDIQVPNSKYYKAQVLRAYSMTSIINEKQARYLLRPKAQVIVEDPTDEDEISRATEIERALEAINYEAERLGDGDVWDRILIDVHLLDEGVEKILFNPQSHWKELVKHDRVGGEEFPMYSKVREEYKKEKGCAIESRYVPLENFLPIYDGAHLVQNFEIDVRSLFSIDRSPVFDTDFLKEYKNEGRWGKLDTMVPIVHHCNDLYYAYYAMDAGSISGDPDNKLKINPKDVQMRGQMRLLYVFKHGLGRSVYNPIAGRFGGWKTQHNRIEVVNKGVLALSQAKDNLFSQMYTNIRASDWPTFNFKVNPDLRGYTQGGAEPIAPNVQEGEEVVTFIGEEIVPLINPQEDPKVPWLMGEVNNQLGNLGGSSVLFGHRQPGVDTGFQNQQQISQAEHLDSKVEEHLAQGAIQHFTIIMQMAKVLGEPIWGHYIEPPDKKTERRTGRYIGLDPKKLTPMPKIDAKVRKVRPVDFMTAGRLANELSNEREGKGPLFSDYTLLTEVLGRDAPDMEKTLIRIEKMENEALANGTVTKMIQDATNLKVVKATQGPQAQPGAVAGADPAAVQAAIQMLQTAPQNGGVDTNLLLQLLTQGQQMGAVPGQVMGQGGNVTGHQNGGSLSGDSQPEQRLGELIASAEQI